MAVLCAGSLQRIEQRPLNTHGVVEIAARLLYDGVNPLKAEAGNLAQPKRTFPQQLHTVRPKVFIDLHGCGGGHLERGQKGHNVTHGLAFRIASLDFIQPLLGDAPDFQQLIRLVLQNIEGLNAEPLDNGIGRFLSDAFQQTGGQIAPDALNGGGHDLMPPIYLELAAILSLCPRSLQLHLNGIRLGQVIPDSGKPNQMVAKGIGTSGILRDHHVCGFQPQDAVFTGRVAEKHPVKCRDNAHSHTSWGLRRFRLGPFHIEPPALGD